MVREIKRTFRLLIIIIMAIMPLVSSGVVFAASNGLGITPKENYVVKPGSTLSDKLYLSNLSSSESLTVSIRVIDFNAANDTGTPALSLAANAPQTPWSLKPFIKTPSSVTVGVGSSAYVPVTISIPANQGAGSYYSALEYTAQNATTQKKVNVAASSATLIFVTVPGTAHESLTLEKFGAFLPNIYDEAGNNPGTFKNWYIGSQPQALAYKLQNNGDVAEDPQGSILIKNSFGDTVKVIKKANFSDSLALIGQTRLFESCIINAPQSSVSTGTVCQDPTLSPGRYTAQLDVLYGISGNNSQEITASTTFWYFPWWSVALIAIIILVLIAATAYGYRKLRNPPTKV